MKNLDLNIFPQIDKDQWVQLAEKQLKGANPEEKLAWKNDAEIALQGYYDKTDIEDLRYLTDFFSLIKPHQWKLYQTIKTNDPKQANSEALESLMGGCDGIILDDPRIEDLDLILNNVDSNICDINVSSPERKLSDSRFTGFQLCEGGNCIGPFGQKNPVDQITALIDDLNGESYMYRTAFSDFYLEISTVRSIRFLLEQRGYKGIHIHTHIPFHESDEHQLFFKYNIRTCMYFGRKSFS